MVPSYSIQQQSCSYSSSGVCAQMSGSIQLTSGSEDDLQSAVANVGPVAVAVDANNNAFRVSMELITVHICGSVSLNWPISQGKCSPEI